MKQHKVIANMGPFPFPTSKEKFKDSWPFPIGAKPGAEFMTKQPSIFESTKIEYPVPGGSIKMPDGSEKVLETDPDGKSPHELGAKVDAGKNRVHLCLSAFSRALEKVSEVTTIGAKKYTPNGWVEVANGYDRYMDAFGRHYLAHGKGEKYDDGPNGTGCEHIAQMIWNLLAAYELSLRKL